jgi:hypothetical protein
MVAIHAGRAGVVAERAAQFRDPVVHGAGPDREIESPQDLEQPVPAHQLVRVSDQVVEQQHRLGSEYELGVSQPGPAGDPVHPQVTGAQRRRRGQRPAPGPRPPQHRPQPREQLVRVEWLVEIVVCAFVERDRALARLAHLSQQHHRQPAPGRAQSAQHLPSVRPRHQDVENAAVRVEPLDQVQRGFPVRRDMHGKPGPVQEWRQVRRDRLVVIGEDHDRTSVMSAHDG